MQEVLLFGQLTDIAGHHTLQLEEVADTDQLVQAVHARYPAMGAIKYMVAVDKKIIQENTPLNSLTSVALLPAFSGG